jgi:hypothetical protein
LLLVAALAALNLDQQGDRQWISTTSLSFLLAFLSLVLLQLEATDPASILFLSRPRACAGKQTRVMEHKISALRTQN